jgi:uncharacterized damage-inducible protein DinB
MDRSSIDRFEAGGRILREAVAGLSAEDAKLRPGPGAWSILELVVHMADSDAIVIDRMKRILTENNPTLLSADETAYVRETHMHEQSMEDALTLFEVGRRQFARVLRALPDEAFARAGTHNVRGRVTLGELVVDYSGHLDHHLGFLRAKRERLQARS